MPYEPLTETAAEPSVALPKVSAMVKYPLRRMARRSRHGNHPRDGWASRVGVTSNPMLVWPWLGTRCRVDNSAGNVLIVMAATVFLAECLQTRRAVIDGPISLLQRRLKLGYRLACKVVDDMVKLRMLTPATYDQRTLLLRNRRPWHSRYAGLPEFRMRPCRLNRGRDNLVAFLTLRRHKTGNQTEQ
jgi:hypothetical protein